jgi:hypothetical protein
MSVQIPLSGSPPASASGGGVRIPIGTRLALPGLGASREEKVVRVISAAAALQDPAEALKLAKQAADDPAGVAANTVEESKLGPVLAKVAAPTTAQTPQPTADQSAAARAVDADPALVAIAQAAMGDKTSAETTEAREWVAMINPGLLERAARAGLRQKNINLVPKPTGAVATSRMDEIENYVKELEKRVKALEDAQKPPGAAARTR